MRVDTGELELVAARLRDVADDLAEAGAGLADLGGVGGLPVGADAMLDALGDLARRWRPRTESLCADAEVLVRAVETARSRYVACEAAARADASAAGDLGLLPWECVTAATVPSGPAPGTGSGLVPGQAR
jgi:hypothetical protein